LVEKLKRFDVRRHMLEHGRGLAERSAAEKRPGFIIASTATGFSHRRCLARAGEQRNAVIALTGKCAQLSRAFAGGNP
jgi:hypothetical protein